MPLFVWDSEPSKIFVGDTPISKVFLWDAQVRPSGWQPWANTIAYYTYNDQWASGYVKDFSWNNRNLTNWTQPTYTLVSWTNYAWNYANTTWAWTYVELSWLSTLYSSFSLIVWVKPTATWQQYITQLVNSGRSPQYSLIYGYKSGQIELYCDDARVTIKSWVSLNTWYCIWMTKSWNSFSLYADGQAVTTSSSSRQITSPYLVVWWSWVWDRLKGQIWECVIEDKVRTAQEVSDYYNQTKANYWL